MIRPASVGNTSWRCSGGPALDDAFEGHRLDVLAEGREEGRRCLYVAIFLVPCRVRCARPSRSTCAGRAGGHGRTQSMSVRYRAAIPPRSPASRLVKLNGCQRGTAPWLSRGAAGPPRGRSTSAYRAAAPCARRPADELAQIGGGIRELRVLGQRGEVSTERVEHLPHQGQGPPLRAGRNDARMTAPSMSCVIWLTGTSPSLRPSGSSWG